MSKFRLLGWAALLGIAACGNPTTIGSAPNGPAIEIASEFPLRGTYSFPEASRAVDVAIAEHPTVGGYRLVHVPLDDSLAGFWDLDRALLNMRRAVDESAIAGVVGPWDSDEARLLIPLTAQADLAVLSPSNTIDCLTAPSNPCLTAPLPQGAPATYFRIAARDSLDAAAAADLGVRKLGLSRFAVFADPLSPPYAETMADAFRKEVAKTGGQVVYSRDVYLGDSNFAPLLREARDAGAQAIYLSTGYDVGCPVREQMAGIFPAGAYLFSGDRLADVGCIQAAHLVGKTDQHFVLTIATGQPLAVPADLKALARGHGYPIYTFAAYDCARILIVAIGRAIRANGGKIPTREQVRAALASTTDFKGITGTYSFDVNGDVVTPSVSFYTVDQGNWAFWRNP